MAANPGHITNGTPEPLMRITEKIEQDLAANQETVAELKKLRDELPDAQTWAQMQAKFEVVQEDLKLLRAYADQIAKNQPEGGRIWTPTDGGPPNQKWRDDFGRFCLDIISFKMDGKARFNSEHWQRAQVEGTDADGGYTVPPEQAASIAALMKSGGLARQLLTPIEMRGKEWRQPALDADPTVTWEDESTAPTETKATFTRPAIIAKKLTAIDSLSIEVGEDSIPSIGNFLVDRFQRCVRREEDRVVFAGDISGLSDPFNGLLFHASVQVLTMASTMTTFDDLTLDDLVNVTDKVDDDVDEMNMRFIFSRSIRNLIRNMKVGSGDARQLWEEMARATPPTILGTPWSTTPVMPKQAASAVSTAFILYGDFRTGAYFGTRGPLRVDFSPHAGDSFAKGNVMMRVLERVGYEVVLGKAIARIRTAAS